MSCIVSAASYRTAIDLFYDGTTYVNPSAVYAGYTMNYVDENNVLYA